MVHLVLKKRQSFKKNLIIEIFIKKNTVFDSITKNKINCRYAHVWYLPLPGRVLSGHV